MGSLAALAAGVLVLTQPEVEQYAQVVASLREEVAGAEVIDVGDRAALASVAARHPHVVIAVGSKAFELAKSRLKETPLVAAAVLSPHAGGRRDVSAVPLEPRAQDALAALAAVAPAARKVVALHRPGSEVALAQARRAAAQTKLQIRYQPLAELSGFQGRFRSLLVGTDAVWLFPDPRLARPEMVRFMVSSCLEHRVALVGFLEAMTRAGALASISADYAAIGKAAARLAEQMRVKHARTPPFAFAPGKVSVNARTREVLGLSGEIPEGYSLIR